MTKELAYDNYWKVKADLGLRWGHLIAAREIHCKSTVLDVGCGNGIFLDFLQKSKDCRCVGVDISESAIRLTKQRGVESYELDVDGKPLPFKDNEFDYVCAFCVLEHLYRPQETLREMRRVGNFLIVTCANPVWWRNRLQMLLGRIPKGPAWRNGQHLYYWNYSDFLELLEKCGWQLVKIFHHPGVPVIQRFSYKLAESLAKIKSNLFAWAYLIICESREGLN